MTPGPAVRILAVAAVSMAALVGLVVHESYARQTGAEVILPMEAVDPRALLSGHYVDITLQEVLDVGAGCPPGSVAALDQPSSRKRRAGWVALVRRADHASVAGAAPDRAAAARLSPIVVRGVAACSAPLPPNQGEAAWPAVVSLDLGVSRFYVSQEQARRITDLLAARRAGNASPVAAIVSVGQDGQARLKGLVVEGRRMELSLF